MNLRTPFLNIILLQSNFGTEDLAYLTMPGTGPKLMRIFDDMMTEIMTIIMECKFMDYWYISLRNWPTRSIKGLYKTVDYVSLMVTGYRSRVRHWRRLAHAAGPSRISQPTAGAIFGDASSNDDILDNIKLFAAKVFGVKTLPTDTISLI